MTKRLCDYKVLSFDCYGTLIDWESGIWDALQPVLMANSCHEINRELALSEFAKLEHHHESETPKLLYANVLTRVHEDFSKFFDLQSTQQLDTRFGNSVPHWPAFPDTADALRSLSKHFKLVILSNISREDFAASNAKLGVQFDAIYTAQDIGSYKPTAANFTYLIEHLERDLGLDKKDLLHTAQSLFHDHAPAKKMGLANAWIDRQRLSESGKWGATAVVEDMPEIDLQYFSMLEMAQAADKEYSI